MPISLDHIFVFCEPRHADLPEYAGLTAGEPLRHPGQGTANARYFFENAYLELIWVEDPAEAQSENTAPTHIWERSRWRETGASPFGLGFRQTTVGAAPPFETWPYHPMFLPPGRDIRIAANSSRFDEPLLFITPAVVAPIESPGNRIQPMNHAMGVRRITGIEFELPPRDHPSPELEFLVDLKRITIEPAESTHLLIEFDGGAAGHTHSFVPNLPMSFRW